MINVDINSITANSVLLGHTTSVVIFYCRAVHGTSQRSFLTEALTAAITALTLTMYATLVKNVASLFERMY